MKLVSSKLQFKCPIFSVTQDEAAEPGGRRIKRAIVQHAGSAVMMAVDEDRRILLVRQYRLPARAFLWELPAGRLDPGETSLAAAKRELGEETGYRAKRWTKLASYYASPGYVAEKMTIYLASELTAGEATPMDDEQIECRWFEAGELDRSVESGKIVDGKTIIGYLMWRRYFEQRGETKARRRS
jgi:ADP-ribose pyrophosphatase